ncbi:MAG: universal stress protein [Actinomycetota bacterium]
MFSKILVGTDGSDTASVAVDHAAWLAERVGAELLIVSAYRPVGGDVDTPLGRTSDHTEDDRARAILEHEQKRHGDRVAVRTILQEGNPADAILDVAEEEGVDLIIVGNKGMTGGKRFLIGSVPNNVSHHAPCHVLIVHTAWAERARAEELARVPGYERILIGTDGSPTAGGAVEVGTELAGAVGAEVLLLFVGDAARGGEVLEQAAADIGDRVPVSSNTAEGDPADRIIDVAVRESCDLIVVGNKGMTGTRRFLLGSVPNNVSHHAPGNVLIAKTT